MRQHCNLSMVVDFDRIAASASEGSEINSQVIFPKCRMTMRDAGDSIDCTGYTDNPTQFIDATSSAGVRARRCAQIGQDTILPPKRVRQKTVGVETRG